MKLEGCSNRYICENLRISRNRLSQIISEFIEQYNPEYKYKIPKPKSGQYISEKCRKPINYKSSMEKTVCIELDQDPKVIEYEYETVKIPIAYKNNQAKTCYIPDFLIFYRDHTKKLVEVKPEHCLKHKNVKKKKDAAVDWCNKNNALFEFWTEKHIKKFKENQRRRNLSYSKYEDN